MSTSPIYLTETDVGRLVTVKDAITALEELFATWGEPSTSNLPRQRASLSGGAFNLMGAAYGARHVHGLKAYAGVKGAQFHTLLYSSRDGRLKAMIEADLFGQLRTGAASGLATRLMANPDARTLAVIGTGRQARTQALAVCAVRPIERVLVFSRTAEPREAFARALGQELAIPVHAAASAEACVAEADVVVDHHQVGHPGLLRALAARRRPRQRRRRQFRRSPRDRCRDRHARRGQGRPIISIRPRWKRVSSAI